MTHQGKAVYTSEYVLRRAARQLSDDVEAKVGRYPFAGDFTRNLLEGVVMEWLRVYTSEYALRQAAKELSDMVEARVGHYPFAGNCARKLFEDVVVEWLGESEKRNQ